MRSPNAAALPLMLSFPHAIDAAADRHLAADLIVLFNDTFGVRENTLLLRNTAYPPQDIGNATEPVYLPSDAHCPVHRIVFAHGFFASALHEIAHWTLAGTRRRTLVDYGYWYEPDDRDAGSQAEFERVEAKPQAIECAFSRAAGFPFRVSADNLSGITVDRAAFAGKVETALARFERGGFPPRAQQFMDVLANFYRPAAGYARHG